MDSEKMMQLINAWLDELHQKAPESIGDLLRFRLMECNIEAGEYVFHCKTQAWMCNPTGTLHGGIIATILDQGMGMIANCFLYGKAVAPSIQLDVAYQRPLPPAGEIVLRVYVVSSSRSLMYLRSEIASSNSTDKICATGTGTYFVKTIPGQAEKYFDIF